MAKITYKRFRHTDYYASPETGKVYRKKKDGTYKQLADRISGSGYIQHYLWKGGKKKHYSAHHIVMEAVSGLPYDEMLKRGLEIMHANHNKTDNRYQNLKWGTRKENAKDTVWRKYAKLNENNRLQRWSDDQIIKAHTMLEYGSGYKEIIKEIGMSSITIHRIKNKVMRYGKVIEEYEGT